MIVTIDAISFAYGACVAVVPTVLAMIGARFWDDWRGGKDD